MINAEHLKSYRHDWRKIANRWLEKEKSATNRTPLPTEDEFWERLKRDRDL